MRNVAFTRKAIIDIEDIRDFIANDNLFYADKVCETILGFIGGVLSMFPNLGKKISDKGLLEIVEPGFKYKIVYRIVEESIIIVAIYKYKDSKYIK